MSLSPLLVTREAQHLNLSLNAPERHNEIDIHLRDALCEAFELALIDETIETLSLSAIGKSFSIGGLYQNSDKLQTRQLRTGFVASVSRGGYSRNWSGGIILFMFGHI